MSTLTDKKISDTYKGLLKTADETTLSATPKAITDGDGNNSGVLLDNAGNLKVNNTLEFGSLKDDVEDITIEKFVDEADGIANNDNDTSLPTSAAVKDYVDTKITAEDLDFSGNSGTGDVDLDSEVFAITGSNGISTTALNNTLDIDGSTLQTAINTNAANITTNATNISQNDADIATNASNISTNASNIASNDTDIATNAANIATNVTNISTNQSNISTNATNIAANTTDIASNAADIASNDTDISNLQTSVSTNTTDIASNAVDISTNSTAISTNASGISTNAAAISTNATDITTNSSNITTNAANIATNTNNIATNTTNIATNVTDIATNANNIASNDTDIATNASNITSNATNIATNAANITSNDTDIATNAANIATNTTNISTNATNIASNDSDISTLQTNVSTNTTNIATNATNIASNDTDIAANASNISTNTTNISTNTSNISSNADDIADLQTDVGLKVNRAGDTMTGNLTMGTNSIFLGGTGTANEFDDYEEGTYNIQFRLYRNNNSDQELIGSSGFSAWTNRSKYQKIGNTVTLFLDLEYQNGSSTKWSTTNTYFVGLDNLPFAMINNGTNVRVPVGGTYAMRSNYQNASTGHTIFAREGGYSNYGIYISLGGTLSISYPGYAFDPIYSNEMPQYRQYSNVGNVHLTGTVTYQTAL